ncbi:MAG: TVP38/TMEM64 family protein [Caulobacterales bacterium]|jgi:uncharacterized membrane protein YdjX (TVP38/TMEM64 family)
MSNTAPPQQTQSPWLRFLPVVVIAGGLGLAYALGLHRHLSLETLRTQSAAMDAFVAQNLPLALLIYMAAYTAAVAFSIPGALFLTLSGGFLFGVWIGGPATVIAATLGATLIFLAAKTAFGDALRARAGGFIAKLEKGFQENAFNYLLTLRLFPGAPFFIVNLVPAFLGVKLRDYFFATLLGIIPGTMVYSAVGAGLRAAFAAGTDVDPVAAARALLFQPIIIGPIIGLIALALLPVIAKSFGRKEQA